MYVVYDRLIQNLLPNLGICWYINYNPSYQKMEADQITLNWTLVLYNYKQLQTDSPPEKSWMAQENALASVSARTKLAYTPLR